MVILKKKKVLGLIFTSVVFVIYATLTILSLVYSFQENTAPSIESLTIYVLQFLAFCFLIAGMVFHKENWILGTLVAALTSSVVTYLVADVTTLIPNGIPFASEPWSVSVFLLGSTIADALLSLGTVFFLIFLLTGRKAASRSLSSAFFLGYLVLDFVSMVFLLIASLKYEALTIVLFGALINYLAAVAYLVDIDAYFFRKNGQLLKETPQARSDRLLMRKSSQKAIASIDEVIARYQQTILSPACHEENGHLVLAVDLTSGNAYEDCSNQTLLSSSIYSYVEDVAFALGAGREVTLRFAFPDGTSEEEKAKIIAIFKAHYAICYRNLRERLTKQMIMAISFVFIGFLLITGHLAYVASNSSSVYGEMLDIFGWVFAWEAIEILCVSSLDNQEELQRTRLLYTAKEEEAPKK